MNSLEEVVQWFIDDVEREVAQRKRPKGGQQVPNFGDFANAPPSTLNRLQWWTRAMKAVLNKKEENE